LPAAQALDLLRASDRFPPGDPRRESAQRKVARLVAGDPAVLLHPALAGSAPMLRRWARFVPYLLPDQAEAAMAVTNRQVVGEQLAALRLLENDPTTSLGTADAALRHLDDADPAARQRADDGTHAVTARRAEATASVLSALAARHLADDGERGIQDWRTRFALVQGTSPEMLAHLRSSVAAAVGLTERWWLVRAPLVGGRYCDRRVGLPSPVATLAEHTALGADGIAAAAPSLAAGARNAAARIRPGVENVVTIEADGRLSATVAHRPTPRGALMVAHETGHAVHALESRSPEPPGALVGETVACWSALVTGAFCALPSDGQSAAHALALGDTLVEELFVSALVSAFEDEVYATVAAHGVATVADLDASWLRLHRTLFGAATEVPSSIESGWARLPSLATDPGHALSYVWATVLALAIRERHPHDSSGAIARAIAAGGVDADEFTALVGFEGGEWIDIGLAALAPLLDSLAGGVSEGAGCA